jgi:amino-acid N-acetyltransferase
MPAWRIQQGVHFLRGQGVRQLADQLRGTEQFREVVFNLLFRQHESGAMLDGAQLPGKGSGTVISPVKGLEPGRDIITGNLLPAGTIALCSDKLGTLAKIPLVSLHCVPGMALFQLDKYTESVQAIRKSGRKLVDGQINGLTPAALLFQGHATIRVGQGRLINPKQRMDFALKWGPGWYFLPLMKLDGRENDRELTPADLRGILKYVPLWRNHTFVIALDGSVIEEETINNLMLQIAVLSNLGIRLLIVYGVGAQVKQLSKEKRIRISDAQGYGPTDHATLELAITAANQVGHHIERGLTKQRLRCVRVNAVRATDKGIIKGVNQLFTGKAEKIDAPLLARLMEQELIPIVSPIAFTRDGSERRINSDSLASDLSIALKASKLIYLLPYPGLTYNHQLRLNADVTEVKQLLDTNQNAIDEPVRSKAAYAVRTIEGGIPRAHIIDCRIHDGLLKEIFSKVGIGSMIHSNPYSQIRKARRKDVGMIYSLTKGGVKDEALRPRTRLSIESDIAEYFVYEIDESVIGCFRITTFPRSRTVELGSVFVHPAYQGRRIGKAMVEFAVEKAKKDGKNRIVALSTQTAPFFRDTCGFQQGTTSVLPKKLREGLRNSGRNSQVFHLEL